MIPGPAVAIVAHNPWKFWACVIGAGALGMALVDGTTAPVQKVIGAADVPLAVLKAVKYGGDEVDLEQELARPSSVDPAYYRPLQGRIPARADGCEEVLSVRTGLMRWSCDGGKAYQEAKG